MSRGRSVKHVLAAVGAGAGAARAGSRTAGAGSGQSTVGAHTAGVTDELELSAIKQIG